ncbi:MAG: hypothetical protein M3063_07690 [Actinomycetota bacterium]|nr:hypothetical protein [Actinomycetota bacterium]
MSEDSEAAGTGIGSFRTATRFDSHSPVVAAVGSDRATKVFVVCLEPGQELARHPAPLELTLLVIEGDPLITFDEKPRLAMPGDVVIVAAGGVHSLRGGSQRAVVVGVLHG